MDSYVVIPNDAAILCQIILKSTAKILNQENRSSIEIVTGKKKKKNSFPNSHETKSNHTDKSDYNREPIGVVETNYEANFVLTSE